MGVDGHCSPVPYNGEHHICGFAPYARNAHEVVDVVGHFAVEILHDCAGCPYQRFCFVVGV